MSVETHKTPNIVVIGGGTGSFTLLQSLKNLTPNITAIVSMADDGGSTGVLRDELGVLPPGDVRQCLVALSEAPQEMRELFNFRFHEGTFSGHSFGNLFLSAVEKMSDNFADGVRMASELLRITGRVVPITLDNVRLVLEYADGSKLKGEGAIDTAISIGGRDARLALEPAARLNPEAKKAIMNADLVVLAPGDLYTSLGPSLIVPGVGEVLENSKAKIVYVCNLVVKPGHTDGFTVANHASEIERFAGAEIIDIVLYNTAEPPEIVSERYIEQGEKLVEVNKPELEAQHYRSIGRAFVADSAPTIARSIDKLATPHSFIRHDSEAVKRALAELLAS
jgi:uncharacterized cofD-like protein